MDMIGERIKKRRMELGLTQEELAHKAGTSKGFLSDIENDHRGVGAKKLGQIAKVLRVSLDYLVTGRGGALHPEPDLQIPAELAALAQDRGLSFRHVQTLIEMRHQIVAYRSTSRSGSEPFDWAGFYESVKGFIPDD